MTNWILACDGSNPNFPFGFACLRCGAQERLPNNIPIDVWMAWGKNFTECHKNCTEPLNVIGNARDDGIEANEANHSAS